MPGIPEADDAVDERLPAFGGWGNAAILIVLRRDFSGLLGVRVPGIDREALRVDAGFDNEDLVSVGRGLDGERSFAE
jgi:hypothetical protein